MSQRLLAFRFSIALTSRSCIKHLHIHKIHSSCSLKSRKVSSTLPCLHTQMRHHKFHWVIVGINTGRLNTPHLTTAHFNTQLQKMCSFFPWEESSSNCTFLFPYKGVYVHVCVCMHVCVSLFSLTFSFVYQNFAHFSIYWTSYFCFCWHSNGGMMEDAAPLISEQSDSCDHVQYTSKSQ